MEKEKLEGLLIDYIDGRLSEVDRAEVEKELAVSDQSYKLYEELREVMQLMSKSPSMEPSQRASIEFERSLRAEQKALKNHGKQAFFSPVVLRAAAGVALVITGAAIGYWINKNQQHEQELAELRREVEASKKLMMTMLVNPQSASQRMLGATVAYKLAKVDDEIVSALIKAMNEDSNVNVRLAALEALSKFHEQEHVRKALIASLATQSDPVVQISLIQILVELKEKESLKELLRITNDEELLPAVKDEAHAGILKLS
jgi:flagellar basal body-associated protein FliL